MKSAAYYLFIASLLGVIVAVGHSLSGPNIEFGAAEIIGIILMPLAVAVLLIWYARLAIGKGWIK